jgi:hypothetical protein
LLKDISNEIPEPKKESAKATSKGKEHQHEPMQSDVPAKPDAKSMLTVGISTHADQKKSLADISHFPLQREVVEKHVAGNNEIPQHKMRRRPPPPPQQQTLSQGDENFDADPSYAHVGFKNKCENCTQ